MLIIAIAKGRLLKPSLAMLKDAGVELEEDALTSRRLILNSRDSRYKVILVKPVDTPTYVEYGAADLGIAGNDVVIESGADLFQPLDLRFGQCRIAVAALEDAKRKKRAGNPTVRVATKYPSIALEYFNSKSVPVEIIPLAGSIELAPLIGLADMIVDLVETGQTLKENGLKIVDVISESSARLVINRASYQTKRQEVGAFVRALEKLV